MWQFNLSKKNSLEFWSEILLYKPVLKNVFDDSIYSNKIERPTWWIIWLKYRIKLGIEYHTFTNISNLKFFLILYSCEFFQCYLLNWFEKCFLADFKIISNFGYRTMIFSFSQVFVLRKQNRDCFHYYSRFFV